MLQTLSSWLQALPAAYHNSVKQGWSTDLPWIIPTAREWPTPTRQIHDWHWTTRSCASTDALPSPALVCVLMEDAPGCKEAVRVWSGCFNPLGQSLSSIWTCSGRAEVAGTCFRLGIHFSYTH